MEDNYDEIEFWVKVTYYAISLFMLIFSILMTITYCKDRYFHRKIDDPIMRKVNLYPCYFNIFYCTIISLSSAIRLIPYKLINDPNEQGKFYFLCSIQSFLVSLFDQFLISLITIYSIVNYLSVCKINFYKNHLKAIYISLISTGFLISLALTIIYFYNGINDKDILCYIVTRNDFKIMSNFIYISILFAITLFCLISLIHNLRKIKNEFQINGNVRKAKKSYNFVKRFILALIINIIVFTYLILLIIKVFPPGSYKDLIYIVVCLVIEIFFTINKSLYNAFMRLITCNKIEKFKDKSDIADEILADEKNEEEDEDDVDLN